MRTRRILVSLLFLAATLTAWAGPYAHYYQNLPVAMEEPAQPSIPDVYVLFTDFGGVGDGVTDNTEAFAKAISALNKKGGGHLVVTAGVLSPDPSP